MFAKVKLNLSFANFCTTYGSRTRHSSVKGRRLSRLTNAAFFGSAKIIHVFNFQNLFPKKNQIFFEEIFRRHTTIFYTFTTMYLELTKMNCLILDDIHPIFIEQATALGLKVDVAINIESTEIERRVGSYEIIVINSKVKVDNVLINKAVKLKYILRPGSGLENVDVEYAASKNIICINSPEGNCNAVAEHTLAMILMWHHKILKAANEVKQGVWLRKENTGIELKNKTIGILGYGNVGMALSDKLLSFGVRILVFDKYKKGFSKLGIEECSVEKIMEEADIISFHVPLTDETNYMVDEHFINQLKKDVLLVNTSRGKVVKTKAIVNALQQKKLLGACLDVLENENSSSFNADEKQDFNYLCNAENVILTPHIAGWTVEAKKDMAEVLIKKIKKIFHN
ncbi:MAG: hypothetical protein RL708_1984 [Bacteroidota bacterium]